MKSNNYKINERINIKTQGDFSDMARLKQGKFFSIYDLNQLSLQMTEIYKEMQTSIHSKKYTMNISTTL